VHNLNLYINMSDMAAILPMLSVKHASVPLFHPTPPHPTPTSSPYPSPSLPLPRLLPQKPEEAIVAHDIRG